MTKRETDTDRITIEEFEDEYPELDIADALKELGSLMLPGETAEQTVTRIESERATHPQETEAETLERLKLKAKQVWLP